MRKRVLVVWMALMTLLLGIGSPGWAAPQPQVRSAISYPQTGMTVSGAVEVRGFAIHPNIHFYQVRYAAGPEATGGSQWVDFAIVEGVQVENDVLGTWDTTTVPDGQYTLALAVWGVNDPDNPYLFFVTHLTVNNAQPVATPTPEEVTPEPMPTAAIGPTPTSVPIQHPATPTPRPSPTSVGEEGGEDVPPSGDEGEDQPRFRLDTEGLQNAFCTGGLITVMLFLLWGLYMLARASVRWYLRQSTGPAQK
jgi:hypothetical protein